MDIATGIPEIPGYHIEKEIGRGAMSKVYLAIQKSLERQVALKVMETSLLADPSFSQRFLKEGKIIAKLAHRNIITIYDIGVFHSCYYMAMEYVSGGTLREHIRRGLSVDQAVDALCQIAEALNYAHHRGFVHRDVKPANILFRDEGTVLLSDFGIAKALNESTQLTALGWTVGTPEYMSPEQVRGKRVDARSDLYSLGIVFYEMLMSIKPYQEKDPFAIALMHINDPLPRLPENLANYQGVLDRLLAKDPADRFASAEDLIEAIHRALDGKGMVMSVHSLRTKAGETEKITINLGVIDLGQIDLLVQEEFYSNRTEFICTAIRNQLATYAEVVKKSVTRQTLDLGLQHYTRDDLEAVRASGETLQIHVLGLVSIADEVTPELARATIDSIVVLGAFHASPAVKAALADRIR